MTALITERFYPQLTTGHPRLDALGRHLGTAALTAAATTCTISAGIALTGTIYFALLPTAHRGAWQTIYTPILGTATWRLSHYTWTLSRLIWRRIR